MSPAPQRITFPIHGDEFPNDVVLVAKDGLPVGESVSRRYVQEPRLWTAETIVDAPADGEYHTFGIMGFEFVNHEEAIFDLSRHTVFQVLGPYYTPSGKEAEG